MRSKANYYEFKQALVLSLKDIILLLLFLFFFSSKIVGSVSLKKSKITKTQKYYN